MQCPSCNTELPKKAKVCPKCGTAIGKPKGNLRVMAIIGFVVMLVASLLWYSQARRLNWDYILKLMLSAT